MANTILSPVIFAKEVIRNRDQKNVFMNYVNRDYEWELKASWDTVTVQILPTLTFTAKSITWAWTGNVWTWPWGNISSTAFAITNEKLIIDKYEEVLVELRDIEKVQSNLTLEEKIAQRFAEAEARMMDTFIRDLVLVTQIANIPAANKINSSSPVTITKTNAIEEIEKMIVALDNQNVTWERVLFVSNNIASVYRQANIFDATDAWLKQRQKGYLWNYGWVEIVQTNALTASQEMIMMAKNAINCVVQLNEYDVRKSPTWFYSNLLAQIIWWGKIFSENAKAIAVNYVAWVS